MPDIFLSANLPDLCFFPPVFPVFRGVLFKKKRKTGGGNLEQ